MLFSLQKKFQCLRQNIDFWYKISVSENKTLLKFYSKIEFLNKFFLDRFVLSYSFDTFLYINLNL